MLQSALLRDHVDALKRLSGVSREPVVAAKLQELADELRIVISAAEISNLAASAPPPLRPPGPTPLLAIPFEGKARRRRRASRRPRGVEQSKPVPQ
jgi:hypothetical protein